MSSARLKAYLALITAALIWGAAQPLIKPALDHISPLQYMFLRFMVALPIGIIVLLFVLRKYRPDRLTVLKVLAVEFIPLTNLLILYNGLRHTTALQSALILDTRPIFITLMGIWFLKEREDGHEWVGLMLSVLGTIIVIISPFLTQSGQTDLFYSGNILILLTNIIYAIGTFFSKKIYQKIPKSFIAAINTLYGFAYFTLLNLGSFGNLPLNQLNEPQVLLPVLYMGIFGTLLAGGLSIYGYLTIEASEATLFQYLQPLVYIPLAVLWLKEPVSPVQMAGLLFILTGVITAAIRLPKVKRRRLRHGIPLFRSIRLAESHLPLHRQR